MTEGPYDYARERFEAMDEPYRTVRIGGQVYDADDVPDEADLYEE